MNASSAKSRLRAVVREWGAPFAVCLPLTYLCLHIMAFCFSVHYGHIAQMKSHRGTWDLVVYPHWTALSTNWECVTDANTIPGKPKLTVSWENFWTWEDFWT